MKLSDIEQLDETASASMTSVSNVGQLSYTAFPGYIKIYKKKKDCDKSTCVARIRRHRQDGWRFKPTKAWDDMKLPHFGQLSNIKTPVHGMKTISKNLEDMLKKWGINYSELMKHE